MYNVGIKQFEKYCLRLLLLRVKGCQSFDDIKTFNGIVHPTFESAARAHKLIDSDDHIIECLNEGVFLKLPKQLRLLFTTLILNSPTQNIPELYNNYKQFMMEDFIILYDSKTSEDQLLYELEDALRTENKSLNYFKLPEPESPRIQPSLNNNIEQLKDLSKLHRSTFNTEQQYAFDCINGAIYNDHKQKLFYIDGPGGSGKTYLYNSIIEYVLGKNDSVVVCASTGIAGTLLINGTTFHSAFKLFPPITSESVCYVKYNTEEATHIISSKLIIIDEVYDY